MVLVNWPAGQLVHVRSDVAVGVELWRSPAMHALARWRVQFMPMDRRLDERKEEKVHFPWRSSQWLSPLIKCKFG